MAIFVVFTFACLAIAAAMVVLYLALVQRRDM